MTDLPFHAFRIGDEARWSSVTCYVAADLGNGMFLFDAGIEEDLGHQDERRPGNSWWIGKFVYQEGIGGREMLDTDNIDVMFSTVSKFRSASRPSTQEIIAALDKAAQMGYEVFSRRPIKIIDQ